MSISGHMIVKNGIKYDYPFCEAILSVLPFCEEVVVVEGFGEDGTYETLLDLQRKYKKIRVYQRPWEAEHYSVLADLTNKAIELCQCDYHYQIQADEVVHEKYRKKMKELASRGYDYYMLGVKHFFSSFDKVYQPGVFYDKFLRLARRDKYPDIKSYGDAMSLGCPDTDPNKFMEYDAVNEVEVYHYGYVRMPKALIEKQKQMTRWWGYLELDPYLQKGEDTGNIDWKSKHPDEQLRQFEGTHPAVMQNWIQQRYHLVQEGAVK